MMVKDGSRPAMKPETTPDDAMGPVTLDATRAAAEARLDAGALFELHGKFVSDFLWRLGVHRQELDDLLQEVFMTAHRRGGFVPGAAKATTWLAEIAVRVASTRRRGWRRRGDVPDTAAVSAAPARGPSPADQAEAQQALARVRQALEALDVRHRAVFILFELEGESCDEIAAGMGVPIGTVYSRLHKARRAFTDAYARIAGERGRGGAT